MSRGPRLTAEKVAEIRALQATGEHSRATIAGLTGVGTTTVHRVAVNPDFMATNRGDSEYKTSTSTSVDTPVPIGRPTSAELRKKLRAGRSDGQLANALLDRQFALYGRRDPRYRNLLIMYGHGQEAELADMLLFDENMAAWAKRTGITPAPA